MNLQTRDWLGAYQLQSLLGERGLGEVWEARDTIRGRLAVLRILPPRATAPHRFARFERDIRLLRSLNHPNLPRIHGIVERGPTQALACEWIAGQPLAARLAHKALVVDEALLIGAQLATALGAAHECAVVHGNLTPANVMVCADGTVKVLDLGLSSLFEPQIPHLPEVRPSRSACLVGVVVGTAAYLSPEQVLGAHADPRSDVWAFGCVLYEMLTGRPAFGGTDLAETMTAILGLEPEWALLPRAMPVSIQQLVRSCLQMRVESRPRDLTVVAASLRKAIVEPREDDAWLSGAERMTASDDKCPEAAVRLERLIPAFRRWLKAGAAGASNRDADDILGQTLLDATTGLVASGPVTLSRFRHEVASLAERDRDLIRARLEHRLGYEAIAARFSIPTPRAARMAVMRAVTRLAARLKKTS